MEKIKIGNACDILNGFAFKSDHYVDDGIRVIRIANVQKGYIEDNTPAFYPAETEGIEKYMLVEGDLLMSLTGNVGRVAIIENEMLPAALNQRVACLRLKTDLVEKGYLFHILNSDFFEKKCIQASNGVAQKNMSTEWLKEFSIPVYSKEEQRNITSILDKLRNIINIRKKEIIRLDDLIKARFVELFGDKKFEKKQLIELIQEGAGLSYGIVVPGDNVLDGIPMVRPSDYKNGSLNLDNVYRVAPDIECKYKKTRLIGDEILVQVIGQPGQVMLSDERCKGMNVTRNLAVVRIDNDKAERLFISHYLTTEEAQRFMFGSTNQSTLKQLPLNKLKELPVPQVPLSEQGKFADFIKQVDKSKVIVQKSLDKAKLLFDSLMQEYFG